MSIIEISSEKKKWHKIIDVNLCYLFVGKTKQRVWFFNLTHEDKSDNKQIFITWWASFWKKKWRSPITKTTKTQEPFQLEQECVQYSQCVCVNMSDMTDSFKKLETVNWNDDTGIKGRGKRSRGTDQCLLSFGNMTVRWKVNAIRTIGPCLAKITRLISVPPACLYGRTAADGDRKLTLRRLLFPQWSSVFHFSGVLCFMLSYFPQELMDTQRSPSLPHCCLFMWQLYPRPRVLAAAWQSTYLLFALGSSRKQPSAH